MTRTIRIRPQQGFDYEAASNPTLDVNPRAVPASWWNSSTGELFFCTDNAIDDNVWQGQSGTRIPPRITEIDPLYWLDLSTNNYAFTDAGKTVKCTDGQGIYTLADRSGNGHDFVQATLSSRPLWQSGVKNGLGVAEFNGTSHLMKSATGISGLHNTSHTYAFVFKNNYVTDNTPNLLMNEYNVPQVGDEVLDGLYGFNNGMIFRSRQADGVQVTATKYGITTTGYYLLIGEWNIVADTVTLYYNKAVSGAVGTGATAGNTNHQYAWLGHAIAAPATSRFRGDLCELICFNKVLTSLEIHGLTRELQNKWSVI